MLSFRQWPQNCSISSGKLAYFSQNHRFRSKNLDCLKPDLADITILAITMGVHNYPRRNNAANLKQRLVK